MQQVMEMFQLNGKTALVTGAGRGIGATCAKVLAQAGAKVVVTDILEKEGSAIADDIRNSGGEAIFLRHNVADEEQWKSVIASTIKTFGALDVLVNNAGIEGVNLIENTPVEQWRQVMKVNAEGVFLGTKQAILAMKPGGPAGRGGSIINMASACGLIGCYSACAYSASKGAVRLLTKVAAVECGKLNYGIRVNSVHPGMIRTELMEEGFVKLAESGAFQSPSEAEASYIDLHPIGKLGETKDVAMAVLYLASDAGKFVTGSEQIVDGGWTAQ